MGDMFQNSSLPFYVHPMDQKRSLKIIKETKAEIKRMESRRPSTPLCTRNVQSRFFNELPLSSRPSSCSSIKSLKYEHEENLNLSSRTLSPIRSHKVRNADIKLEPIVSKPVLFDRRNTHSSTKLFKERFTVFPPLPCDEKKSIHALKSLAGSLEKLQICPITKEPLLKHDSAILSDASCNYIDEDLKAYTDTKLDTNTSSNPDNLDEITEEQSLSTQLSEELNNVLPLLEKYVRLGSKKKEDDVISIVKNIFCLLEEKNAFLLIHDNRIPLLKVLFRLLDSNFPALSLHIVKLLLKMRIKEKNLCSVFRLISKLLKDQEIELNKYDLIDSIIETIFNTTAETNGDAVLYGIRILQTLITAQKVQKQQKENCLNVLFHQLRESNFMISCREKGDGRCDEIVYMVMTLLKNLVEDKSTWEVLTTSENLTEILKTLNCSQDPENVHLIVCLLSKIVDDKDGCKVVACCCKDDLVGLLSILETHRYSIDITLQTAFIIGNLVSVNDSTAQTFVWSSNFINILVVLGEYISEHIQFKDTVSDCFKSKKFPMSSGDRNLHHQIFEVILKVLCIFANICLHPNAGSYLAKHPGILSHLLAIIAAYAERDGSAEAGIAIYSFLVVVSNVSYYLESDSEFCIKTAETIIPILDDSFSFEVRLEAANVIRNLTRSSEVRDYIRENALLPAFVKLLDEDEKAFSTAAYGIIMNLLIDENSRQIFYEEQGVTKVLHKLHLCADRDWKTCALLCQVLWNYFGGESGSIEYASKIEAQHLVKYLSYSLHNDEINMMENEESDYYQQWKTDFCPVANKLLKLLQAKKAVLF
ncbi:Armadillo repeat-containing protein 2 [Araneus ventricosus]|uniref:Armadillo repeat-containing protein 2 n=1 Tax=Araneus ventricosus TaxID=182803 RepID=A0A4Y2IQG2_ARAVE|nr:Armadillo repeat-containing protein 2 [Araneus ventricosus]